MTQSILVLEENHNIQEVIASSLNRDDLSIIQESNPDLFVKQALELRPDLIFLSNSDSNGDYQACREIRKERELENIPVILLANARDKIDSKIIKSLEINGLLHKPFEAAKLRELLGKYISIDDSFNAGLEGEEVSMDMGHLENDISGLMQEKTNLSGKQDSGFQSSEQKKRSDQGSEMMQQSSQSPEVAKGSDMDSLLLDETMDGFDMPSEAVADDLALDDLEALDSIEDSDELDLNLDVEDEMDMMSATDDIAKGGLEELKDSGLEDRFVHSQMMDEEEEEFAIELSDAVDEGLDDFEVPTLYEEDLDLSDNSDYSEDDEDQQTLREGLSDIDLEVNDIEEPEEMWTRPPNLNQKPRSGMRDISLKNSDFNPEMPKNLVSMQSSEETIQENNDSKDSNQILETTQKMDYYQLEASAAEMEVQIPHPLDIVILSDSGVQGLDAAAAVEDPMDFMLETSEEELEDDFDLMPSELEDENSFNEINLDDNDADSALEELEDLNLQMDSLEEDEAELQSEVLEFEEEVELEKEIALEESFEEDAAEFESALDFEEDLEEEIEKEEALAAAEASKEWADSKDEIREFMVSELGDLLEKDEEELELTDAITEADIEDLRDFMISELGDLLEDDDEEEEELQAGSASEATEEEAVFASWDDAEDAFLEFDREDETTATEPAVKEEVFASWDDAEDAFLVFDREDEAVPSKATDSKEDATVKEEVFDGWGDAEDAFMDYDREDEAAPKTENKVSLSISKLSEEELTNIVTHSVQKALEGSISTLVKQVVSELKERDSKKD